LLPCRADGHARPAGGGADIGDRREQGVLPEIIVVGVLYGLAFLTGLGA